MPWHLKPFPSFLFHLTLVPGAPTMLDDYDDELHRPDDRGSKEIQRDGKFISWRGLVNLGCFIFVCVGIVTLL
jgi:hypothetical protein